jgi:hypothetical protein
MLDIDLELPDPQNPKVLECEGWYELTSSAVASSGAEARIDMRVRFSDGDVLARQFEQRSSQMPPFTRETLQEFGGKRSETAGNVADVLDNAGNPIRGPAGTTQRSLALLWYRRGAQSGVDPNRVSWSGATFLVSSRMLVDVEIPGQHPLAAVKLRSWVDHAFGPLGR